MFSRAMHNKFNSANSPSCSGQPDNNNGLNNNGCDCLNYGSTLMKIYGVRVLFYL